MNHFTNRDGFNGIDSQPDWPFRACQPLAPQNPAGAYFTTYPPDEPRLSVKIFVPKEKLAYLFAFTDLGDLKQLPGGRGRLRRIFYSPTDYIVVPVRQKYSGASSSAPADLP